MPPRSFGFGERMWYKLPMLRFTKMNGAGNDFIMIDNRAGDLQLAAKQISRICDRHRGVGADGVLVLERPKNGANFRMRYYNADGRTAEFSGAYLMNQGLDLNLRGDYDSALVVLQKTGGR